MNVGERDEILTKLTLIYNRDNGDGYIYSIMVAGKECKSLPDSIKALRDLDLLNDDDLIAIAKYCGCYKSPSTHKADVAVNGVGISLKSLRGSPPAIINHTSRVGIKRVCDNNCDAGTQTILDNAVQEYHRLRKAGAINEDISNDNVNSPFRPLKEELKKILNYFVFKGTGARDSKFPAQYMVDIDDPFDMSTWKAYDESNFIDENWDKIVFSMRSSKGMGKYPNVKPDRKDCMSVWVEEHQEGKYSGAFHARLKK